MATHNNRSGSSSSSRASNKRESGEVKQDPSWFITCLVKDPVKSFTITFDPKSLSQKIEKYGDRLIVPLGLTK
jgi:hypothetical protein